LLLSRARTGSNAWWQDNKQSDLDLDLGLKEREMIKIIQGVMDSYRRIMSQRCTATSAYECGIVVRCLSSMTSEVNSVTANRYQQRTDDSNA